jgi:hypothetical protein
VKNRLIDFGADVLVERPWISAQSLEVLFRMKELQVRELKLQCVYTLGLGLRFRRSDYIRNSNNSYEISDKDRGGFDRA